MPPIVLPTTSSYNLYMPKKPPDQRREYAWGNAKSRVQVCLSKDCTDKIDALRGDVPVSVWLRRLIVREVEKEAKKR